VATTGHSATSTNTATARSQSTAAPVTSSAPSTSSNASSADATAIGFDQLVAEGAQRAGEAVAVRVRAFFLEQCPPPGSGQTTPCSLSLFVTEPERDHLLYADRASAVPVFDTNGRVTCHVGDGITVACPGWVHGARYELTAVVTPSAAQPGLELHVSSFLQVDD
jgi:hypothetical protein